jgi:hypothetical protein
MPSRDVPGPGEYDYEKKGRKQFNCKNPYLLQLMVEIRCLFQEYQIAMEL